MNDEALWAMYAAAACSRTSAEPECPWESGELGRSLEHAVSIEPCASDGWIPWHGGENPVPGKRVVVRFRDGTTESDISSCFYWDNRVSEDDIIAYKVIGDE